MAQPPFVKRPDRLSRKPVCNDELRDGVCCCNLIIADTYFFSRKVCTVRLGNMSHIDQTSEVLHGQGGIILSMLPDLQLNDHLRLRKPHPCGSYEWTVIRLGADIGLECKGCQHRVMLTRRELAKRMKENLTKHEENNDETK
jgi:hypothetical protein